MALRANNWELIEEQLDTMVRHAVALKLGMANAESLSAPLHTKQRPTSGL